MRPFILTSDVDSLKGESSRIVEVPYEFSGKSALLAWYAEALGMPGYFGANWDALEECLRDLSWISEHRVVLYHRAVPLESSALDQKVYVEVLANAVRDWRLGEAHELVVAFDPACEPKLRATTRAQ